MKKIGITGTDSNLILAVASAILASKGKNTVFDKKLSEPTKYESKEVDKIIKSDFNPQKSSARTNKFFSVKKRYRKA
ncbi:hypothetical protein D3C87_1344950 [compost metagenome]